MDIRCADLSLADAEALAGTAPTEADWLLVEHSGSWGRRAVAESNLPDEVREHLLGLAGVRVQLIRRHGRETAPTSQVRVFTVSLGQSSGQRAVVRSAVLADVGELLSLDLAADAGAPSALTPYDEPLWLVCTNGRRDVCCAEIGRPVAAALAARWPDATWETTHLGGHRFSGTLLALPSGLALGRLDAESAVRACEEVEAGRVPALLTRDRPGRGELAFADVETLSRHGDTILLSADGEQWQVVVAETRGEPRRQSCSDDQRKAAPVYVVRSAGRASAPSS